MCQEYEYSLEAIKRQLTTAVPYTSKQTTTATITVVQGIQVPMAWNTLYLN